MSISKVHVYSMMFFMGVMFVFSGCHHSKETAYQLALDKINSIEKTKVDVIPVSRGQISAVIRPTGTLLPVRATTVSAEVGGKIVSFLPSVRGMHYVKDGELLKQHFSIDLGTEVKQGDELFAIDPTDYLLALERAQAALDLAKMNREELLIRGRRPEELDQLKAVVDQAKAQVEQTVSEFDRMYQLVVVRKTETKAALDDATAARDIAKANWERATASLELANTGPSRQQLAVCDAQILAAEVEVKLCEDQLRKTKVLAPYDALVTERFNDIGNYVSMKDSVLEIIDTQVLFAEVNVPEEYQNLITFASDDPSDPNKNVQVFSSSSQKPHLGQIDMKNAKIDPTSRCARVRVTIENFERTLHPGGFVRVEIPIDSSKDAVVIPRNGVTLIDGEYVAFVYKDGTVERRVLQLGLSSPESYEVKQGLNEGELLVTGHLATLSNTQQVALNSPENVGVVSQQITASSDTSKSDVKIQ